MSRNRATPFIKQCFVTVAVGINTIGHGCAVGLPAILLPQLNELGSGFQLTKEEESWIASIFPLSMLTGNLFTALVIDRLGRKRAHIALTVPLIVGWFMTTLATNLKTLIIARVVHGIFGGILANLRSVLIGEYTSPKNRGGFLTTISLTQAFGIFFVHLIGSLLSWQKTALICAFLPFVSLLMIIYTPESPCWLAGEGRYNECSKVFRWLRGDEEEEELKEMIEAQIELEKMKIKNNAANSNSLEGILEAIKQKEFYKPNIVMIHAVIMLQFCGASTLPAFSTFILSLIMGPAADVHFWMVVLDTQRLITNTVAVYVINQVKRRTMLFSTGVVNVIIHLVIVFYVYGKSHGWIQYESVWLPALLINIQVFTLALAMTPLSSVIAGEIFPLEYRSISGAISMGVGGTTMFLVLKTFPTMVDSISLPCTYIIYSIIISYCLVVMWFILIETKGRTLQQIEDAFRGRPLKPHEIETRKSFQMNPHERFRTRFTESSISIAHE